MDLEAIVEARVAAISASLLAVDAEDSRLVIIEVVDPNVSIVSDAIVDTSAASCFTVDANVEAV